MLSHLAIFWNNHANKNALIEQITQVHFGLLSGAIYAASTLNGLINEELNHGRIEIKTNENAGLTTMSSGQQKRALLAHLIDQKPDYLIVDDVFSNLDQATQTSIAQTLEDIAKAIIVVQLFHRKADLLPFISDVWICEGDKITQKMSNTAFVITQQKQPQKYFDCPVPKALTPSPVFEHPLIIFKDVSVNYGEKKVLDKLNWTVNHGDFWQIIGPNGCGKSTVLSMITGDNPKAYQQDITLFGRKKGSGESVWQIKKQIGYCNAVITQQFARLDSVENMLVSGFFDQIGLYTKPSELQLKIAQDWLRLLGLFEQKNKPFMALSLGQQRMTMVARAMIKHPPLLILDEVTAGLDDDNVAIFTALINKVASESHTAILYVSHRAEYGLNPKMVLELIPNQAGSVGRVVEHQNTII